MTTFQLRHIHDPLPNVRHSRPHRSPLRASKTLLSSLAGAGVPGCADMLLKAIDIEFCHTNETMDPVIMTGGHRVLPATTCDECPPLDFLLAGGPDLNCVSE